MCNHFPGVAVPYMTFESNLQWLSAVKAGAPGPAFEKIMKTIREVMSDEEFRKLEGALSGL